MNKNSQIINREWFTDFPEIPCPRCGIGIFIYKKREKIELEDGISKESKILDIDPSYYSGKFTITSNCNHPKCEESSIISGKTKLTFVGWYEGGYDPEQGIEIPEHEHHEMKFKIEYISPPFNLISFPIDFPNNLQKILEESFKLFWIDKDSCGNKLRIFIEELLSHQKIKKNEIKNRKRYKLSLHKRIMIFQNKYPKLGDKLLAIKWIGNTASHGEKELSKQKIIDAFNILEFIIEKLFENKEKEIDILTKRINKAKG